ncbi:glycoside hydrolase family 13 protein [Aquiluna borgnonia]|uniref:Glycoside hydrolase family 13 protein n=1 Tax=Aquiluna borgnonia TaxID=2499157 RepID=A0A7D4TL01_9MICO|nr:glycoside hydrolase family 13 protein [Aquiluna borgnonia]QKJ25752.1 glycoside hydrolase family 13 protein [Aquiluna borgnonia]
MPLHEAVEGAQWWRSGAIYQIYPRSFADANGDGMGDLKGITQRLSSLAALGIDAIWLSPFYRSPQKDAGYDVSDYVSVDPLFGTLEDFDEMVTEAHRLSLRVMIDLVPNHSSSEHEWFQKALKAGPGSRERSYYHFKDGKGDDGELPPNNWQSMFGGPAWTRVEDGQWYAHLFDSSQPDLNWENPQVREEFEKILRFWLDRGVDGFRVDQPHAMAKAEGLPDHPYVDEAGAGFIEGRENPPMWFQDSVHEIFRDWRKILDSYPGDRAMCGEAYVLPLSFMALWVRPDEFHQTFNFRFLDAGWDRQALVSAIDESFEAFDAVGAPSTWVLNNHDVLRHVSRFGGDYGRTTASDGVGPNNPQPDNVLGLQKARAATLFMLGLPGASYLYQGEELGLPDHTTIAEEHRQDPTFFRTSGQRVGRDGCRVPLPWEMGNASNGFNQTGKAWLPQPDSYAALSRDQQQDKDGSTLTLYQLALKLRKQFQLGEGSFDWVSKTEALSYQNGKVQIVHNFSSEPKKLTGEVVISSMPLSKDGSLLPNDTAWVLV